MKTEEITYRVWVVSCINYLTQEWEMCFIVPYTHTEEEVKEIMTQNFIDYEKNKEDYKYSPKKITEIRKL
jgi:hypothetical protein